MTVKEMREKRAKAIADARAILDTATNENRALSADENTRFDTFHNEAESLKTTIERLEQQEAEERALSESRGRVIDSARVTTADSADLRRYLLGETAYPQGFGFRLRAQSVGTDSEGGYSVANEPMAALETALKTFGGIRQVARVIRTSTGADLPMPTLDDTTNAASIIGENTALGSGPDLVFSQVVLKAFKFSSGIVLVPLELIQDAAINVGQVVGDALGTRIGRKFNNYATVGTGTGQPQGATAATSAMTQTTLGAVTYAELVDMVHSVDAAYRSNAVWMMHDTTLAAIRKLLDGANRPIFWSDAQSLASGVEGTILGYRYVINNDMPELTEATKKSILFGDFQRGYIVRDVQDVNIIRLNERYADTGQIAFVGLARMDGRLTDAGSHPVKAFTNHA